MDSSLTYLPARTWLAGRQSRNTWWCPPFQWEKVLAQLPRPRGRWTPTECDSQLDGEPPILSECHTVTSVYQYEVNTESKYYTRRSRTRLTEVISSVQHTAATAMTRAAKGTRTHLLHANEPYIAHRRDVRMHAYGLHG